MGIDNKRIDYIDIAKAIGMLLIAWGHTQFWGWSNAFVYAFHIPLFFFLSGMVFDSNRYAGFTIFVRKKAKSLLLPYVVYSVVIWCVWVVYSYLTDTVPDDIWGPLLQTVVAQGSSDFLVHDAPLWFVTCLFVVEMLYYFIAKLPSYARAGIVIALPIISFCLINYVPGIDFTLMPWNIEVALLAIPFYASGHALRGIIDNWSRMLSATDGVRVRRMGGGIVLLSFVVIGCLCSWNGSISFGHADMGRNVFVTYFSAYLGTFMVLLTGILIANSRWKTSRCIEWLKWFGINSFAAMAIHCPIKGAVAAMVHKVCGNILTVRLVELIIVYVITIACTVVGIVVINKAKALAGNNSSK